MCHRLVANIVATPHAGGESLRMCDRLPKECRITRLEQAASHQSNQAVKVTEELVA